MVQSTHLYMATGIYRITSPTGKVYIGQSRDMDRRHNVDYKYHNCINQRKLYASIKYHGWSNHECIVLQELPDDIDSAILDYMEQTIYDWYKELGFDMMNVRKIVRGGWLGKHDESAIDRIRKGNTGKIVSVETREKLSKIHKGKVMSQETKRKISESKTGSTQPREAVERRRISCTGKKRSAEFCKAASERRKGKKMSEDWCKKQSERLKGKPGNNKGKHWKNKKSDKKRQYKKHELITCPHCNVTGGKNALHRYHFDNCKQK